MDEQNNKHTENENTAEQAQNIESGEYHFVRPERNLYEDANFAPSDEEPEIHKYYVPNEKKSKEPRFVKSKKPKGLFVKIACLCLVCAVVGGLAGGAVTAKYLAPQTAAQETEKPISSSVGGKTVSSSGTQSTTDIYALGTKQAVGVTTEVTTTNWFGQTSSTAVSGSGFVVTADGYIITNYHVIEYAYKTNYKVSVMFYDGTAYEASIVGVDESNDIAVLKVDATGLTPIEVGDSDDIAVGEEVYAIGNPLGELDFTMTTGHVSALGRSITTEAGGTPINMFQFDAAVNSGNSGGPLYNSKGQVIGVVTAKYSETGVEGIGFAIPVNDAVSIANDLITQGYVSGKASLGANIDNRYTSVYASYYNMPEGAYVFSVEPYSAAENCGLAAGDIITKLGDKEIKSYSELESAIRQFKAGESTNITVFRSGEYKTLKVTFDELKPNTDSSSSMQGKSANTLPKQS